MITTLLILVILIAIGALLFYRVPAIRSLLRDSETIAVQVVKALVGAVAAILTMIDPDMVQTATQTVVTNLGLAKWWPVWALGLGIAMIAVRQVRRED